MILRNEIQQLSALWNVPPDTVDKDYVLGHFLSIFLTEFSDQLLFKGGTCLRKCYFPEYRFSEDLDFSSRLNDFVITQDQLANICQVVHEKTGIIMVPGEITPLRFQDIPKGFQVRIKYWGANHGRSQQPPPHERWTTAIKLEISTDEIILLPPQHRTIHHPYSDSLTGVQVAACYDLREIVSEKLRSLIQRSYTAPRDYFDIYQLTLEYSDSEWAEMRPIFFKKLEHKQINFEGPDQLVNVDRMEKVRKSWKASLDHQIYGDAEMETIISYVYDRVYSIF
jgi:predicted nucleotidyltransferase component of viral defense system